MQEADDPRDAMLLPDEVLFRLAREVGTPLTIYDEADIRRRAQALRSAFAWNGGFHNFFPVSCCANPAILRILCEEGFGLACRTTEELRLAGEAGCAPDMTRYMPIFPSPEELHTCRETGDLVLDDADLILRLERLGELPNRIALRYCPKPRAGMQFRGLGRITESCLGMDKAQLLRGVRELRLKGTGEIGLMMQVHRRPVDCACYFAAARLLFSLAAELKQLDLPVGFCDLGGDLRRGEDLGCLSAGIRREFEQLLSSDGMENCGVQLQLGRALVFPGTLTLATVNGVKQEKILGLDLPEALLSPASRITVLGNHCLRGRKRYAVTDRLGQQKELRLLPECRRGSVLALHPAELPAEKTYLFDANGILRDITAPTERR